MKTPNLIRSAALSSILLSALIGGCGGEKPEVLIASGKEYLEKKDNKAAVIQLKNALQQNPNLGEARFLLGKALLEGGDAAGAEVELRKAFELKYANEQTVPLLARALLTNGQAKKVIDEFAQIELPRGQPTANLKTLLSTAYQVQGNRESAQAALTAALSAQPDYAPALLADVRQKLANRDFSGAQAIVDGILAKSPNDHEALMLKGFIVGQGNPSGALEWYRKALEAKPDFLFAHSTIITGLLEQGKPEEATKQFEALKKIAPKHPQTIFLDTQLALQRKDYKAARELSQQLLKIYPNNPNFLQIAGAVEYQLRSYVQAESYLTKALQQSPDLLIARRLLITNYLRAGQAAKAMAALTPVLGKIDKDSTLLSLAGQTFLMNGNPKKAGEYFTKASQLDPNDASKKTSVALSHMAQGDLVGGFNELERISASDKGNTADLARIAAYLRLKDFDHALKAIDSLEKKQPDNPRTFNLRGETLLAKKDLAGARKSFEKALSINPAFLPAALRLATLDVSEKKYDDAAKRLEAVLAEDPKSMGALLALADVKNASGGKPEQILAYISKAAEANPTETGPRLAQIEFHLRNKDIKQALTTAQNAVSAMPDKPELLNALAKTQQLSGDSNQALLTYGKLAGLEASSPIPHVRMAEIHFAGKNPDEAAKSLRKALEIKPDFIEAQSGLIRLAMEDKKPQEALAIAQKIQSQHPKNAIGYALEGDIHVSSKKWSDAVNAYRAGLKQVASSELAIKLHSALLTSGNGAEAERSAASWAKEHPKDMKFRVHLGDIAISRKDYAGAAQQYRAALDIQPNNALILNNLAWISGQMKSPKAIEYAEKANQLAPNQPAFMDTQAMLLADRGESAKAIELLRKALALSPEAAEIKLNLAKVLIGAGNKSEAGAELEALAKLGDKFPNQAEVARLQKEL